MSTIDFEADKAKPTTDLRQISAMAEQLLRLQSDVEAHESSLKNKRQELFPDGDRDAA